MCYIDLFVAVNVISTERDVWEVVSNGAANQNKVSVCAEILPKENQ